MNQSVAVNEQIAATQASSEREVVVIGSGPAGYTAALYLARAELKPLVFAGESWGGQLMLTTEVENYPGFEKGIMGPELMEAMRKQAARFGSEIVDKNVSRVDFSQRPFSVWVGDEKHTAKTVVIATGAESKLLGVKGEKEFMGRGVSTCAVCDAPFYKGKQQTYVVGGGDAAMEEALALAKYANKVGLIHRRDTLKASKIMQRKVREKKNIEFLLNSEVMEVQGFSGGFGQAKATAVVVKNNKTGQTQTLKMDGIFIAIGHTPMTDVFKGQLELDEKGYVVTGLNGLTDKVLRQSRHGGIAQDDTAGLKSLPAVSSEGVQQMWLHGYPTMTSMEGVFAAGDVVDFRYRQAVTAAGFGCMAAMDVEKFLTGTTASW